MAKRLKGKEIGQSAKEDGLRQAYHSLTRKELAARLDVHPQTVTKWEGEGLPVAHRGGKGRPSHYDEVAVRAWLVAREEAAAAPGAPLDLAQERARKEKWQGLLAEQTFKVRARELLPAADVKQLWAAEQAAVRTRLMAVPVAAADRVSREFTLRGIPGVEQALKEVVYDVLRELADVDRDPSPPSDGGQEARAA